MTLLEKVAELEKTMQCNCDLGIWESEVSTGHSWVCCIHKAATNPNYAPPTKSEPRT